MQIQSTITTALSCRDNIRGFFEQCFSQLLKQIFGYDGSSWLDQVAQASHFLRSGSYVVTLYK
jgi:hypothetical protein